MFFKDKIFNFFVLIVLFSAICNAQKSKDRAALWVADQKDGTYKNPILYKDFSDPDVIRVGDDFYMTASSFNEMPGLPILHSVDMVNWELINYAISALSPLEHYSLPKRGNGVWAPAIRYHNQEFYIYWGDPDFGIFMVKTRDPRGNWDQPILVMAGLGLIDPCPFWDEDGEAYLVHGWAGSRAGVKSLLTINLMNSEGTKVLDAGKHVFDGHTNHPTVEGPKLYKRNGYYYIFAPAGGVATGWQLVLRSKNIYGPYEEKIVLEQGKSKVNGPHQGAWVDTPMGEDWFFHFQDLDTYGRIVHLQPMKWQNDWPIIGIDKNKNGIGEPVQSYTKPIKQNSDFYIPESDEFDGKDIGLQWQWSANLNPVWYAKLPGNEYLRLFSIKSPENKLNLWFVPNLLTQKFPAPNFEASTKVKLFEENAESGKYAGLLVMGLDYQSLVITHKKGRYYLQLRRNLNAELSENEMVIEEMEINSNQVYMKVSVSETNGICRFFYSENGKKYLPIGDIFQAKPGKWIGAKVGIFSVSEKEVSRGGYADFDYFRFSKP